MLDNVIDINFYPTVEAKTSNMKHRPVGLGLMGLQDALFMLKLPFDSAKSIEFVDSTMEYISYNAILASSELAKERGAYPSFQGSKWSRNLLPYDTLALLEKERGEKIEVNKESRLDWTPVREHIQNHGMRNSNTLAIAPTATISNIAGAFPCIEPIYKNIYVKSNMSGEFTIVNQYLVQELKQLGLWDEKMREKIKYYDGNIDYIEEIPLEIRDLYKEVFDIDPASLLRLTAVRSKWIDQSQSHNVFIKGASGKKLHDTYFAAWKMGLKTTYYLRTLAATQIEKSTLDAKQYGYTQKRSYDTALSSESTETVPERAPGGELYTTDAVKQHEKSQEPLLEQEKSHIVPIVVAEPVVIAEPGRMATPAPSRMAAPRPQDEATIQRKQILLSPSDRPKNKASAKVAADVHFDLNEAAKKNPITSNTICSLLEPDCESCQ